MHCLSSISIVCTCHLGKKNVFYLEVCCLLHLHSCKLTGIENIHLYDYKTQLRATCICLLQLIFDVILTIHPRAYNIAYTFEYM